MSYFNFLWIIGSGFFAIASLFFWLLMWKFLTVMGIGKENAEISTGIATVICFILAIISMLAPYNNFYQFLGK